MEWNGNAPRQARLQEEVDAQHRKDAAIAAATTELFSLRTSADRATFVAADGAG
jgi:hypothetical protein